MSPHSHHNQTPSRYSFSVQSKPGRGTCSGAAASPATGASLASSAAAVAAAGVVALLLSSASVSCFLAAVSARSTACVSDGRALALRPQQRSPPTPQAPLAAKAVVCFASLAALLRYAFQAVEGACQIVCRIVRDPKKPLLQSPPPPAHWHSLARLLAAPDPCLPSLPESLEVIPGVCVVLRTRRRHGGERATMIDAERIRAVVINEVGD